MAEEEKSPLLEGLESTDVNYRGPRETVRDLYRRGNRLGINGQFSVDSDRSINISSSNSVQNLAEVDHIVAIFVVAFDTRSGNLIEWCMPEDADLEGIEFKAMTSGSHTLHKDFVYFKKDSFFGLACFENMKVESEIERGARMKSVGILSTSYTLLYRHMQFLETQVRHQLEVPGKYSQLKAFYEDKKGMLPSSISIDSIRFASPASTPSSEVLPELKITHPAGCFSQFMKFFGENVFTLWKYVLLQKRILFFSPPPIGVVCYRVYCGCSLGNHSMPEMMSGREPKPFFYVNVADIETLESEVSYIACTTEKIFESKTHLYDVYVDNQNLTANTPALKELLKPSDADRDKSAKLNNQRSAHLFSMEELGEENVMDEEELFTSYFTELNNRLFQTLLDVAGSQDRQLTSDHMRNMGLDPIGDRPFLMELVETYGIDVMLMVDNPCCPR
ncbi:DENN domain-containing protein 11-like isoform X2 [Lineus longissimus]|uniref:DENN domain-containing protein 11-like isoform X2 n=1 Tax=Lineus longissimus TaxID=88925 RepID=UPI002B4D6289